MSIGRRSHALRALFPVISGAALLFGSAMPQAFAQLLQGSIIGNVSDAGQAAHMTNPAGFANVRAHAEAHLHAMQHGSAPSVNTAAMPPGGK